MNNKERAPTVHAVKVLDLSAVKATALSYQQGREGKEHATRASIYGGPQGIVQATDGKHYWICEEGVLSTSAVEDGGHVVDFHFDYEKDGEHFIGMMAEVSVTLEPGNVLDLPVKDTVSLDAFVRTFGARLEQNYASANQWLSNPVN